MAPHRPPEFRGRASERGALDRLLENVREGQSAVLVIRGEPGVGKSALLRYCVRQASGFRVARCVAIESEMELPFAGLHQLCAPMLTRLGRLPAPQRDALSTAFGLSSGAPSDRFLVALAALSLLAEVAEEQELLCVVDDTQWLDRASAQVLGFVARRLLAESVAIVFAVREPSEERELIGLPELVLEGLGETDARALLATVVPGRLDELVRDRIVAETRGNPLALLDLPRGLTAAELAGGFALPDAGNLPLRIEDSYVRRLQGLPEATRRLMLLAAADPTGDATLVRRAAQTLGIGAEALTPAEAERLLEIGARVQISPSTGAVGRVSRLDDREQASRSRCACLRNRCRGLDPDRRAWHRAHAASGSDEEVAGELMHSRARAQRRGGIAAAAAFLERAAALSADPSGRAPRALAAAEAKFAAGDVVDAAQALLTVADVGPLDELARAQVQRLRAEIAFQLRRGNEASPQLLQAAQRLEALDAELARDTYLEAMLAALRAGRFATGTDVLDVSEAARSAHLGSDPLPAKQLLLVGLATRFTDGYVAAAPTLKKALHSYRDETRQLDWACLACAVAAMDLWDDATWLEIVSARARLARATGTLSFMPLALEYLIAGHHILARRALRRGRPRGRGRESGITERWRGDAAVHPAPARSLARRGAGCAGSHRGPGSGRRSSRRGRCHDRGRVCRGDPVQRPRRVRARGRGGTQGRVGGRDQYLVLGVGRVGRGRSRKRAGDRPRALRWIPSWREPARAEPTGRRESRRVPAHSWPTARTPRTCTSKRSSISAGVAWPRTVLVQSSSTGSGCVARIGAPTLASSCIAHTTRSRRWGSEALPIVRAASWWRRASECEGTGRPATS